jgi:hypothetical protein
VLLGGLVLALARSNAPQRVHRRVASQPSGAAVYFGGQLVGRTPLDVEAEPSAGEGLYRVEAPGFAPRELRLALDRDAQADVTLTPLGR